MEETSNDKFKIRLQVYDEPIYVTVDRDEERIFRAAAERITARYGAYRQMFEGKKTLHTIAMMTLVEFAVAYEKELVRNDTKPYDDVLSQLTSEIEEALKS